LGGIAVVEAINVFCVNYLDLSNYAYYYPATTGIPRFRRENPHFEGGKDMFKRVSCLVAVLAVFLGFCRPVEACGRWRCRHRPCDVCQPPNVRPDQQVTGADYIVNLATSIASAASRVHQDKTLADQALKGALLEQFRIQIGGLALRPNDLDRLVGGKRKIRLDDLTEFGGEVRRIAIRLGEANP
jgi:hypothetical protein